MFLCGTVSRKKSKILDHLLAKSGSLDFTIYAHKQNMPSFRYWSRLPNCEVITPLQSVAGIFKQVGVNYVRF